MRQKSTHHSPRFALLLGALALPSAPLAAQAADQVTTAQSAPAGEPATGTTQAPPAAADPTIDPFAEAVPVPGLVNETLPSAETVPPEQVVDEPAEPGTLWPWFFGAALLLVALVLLLARRRRTGNRSYAEAQEQRAIPVVNTPEPVTASAMPGAAAATVASTAAGDGGRPTADRAAGMPEMEPPLAAELAGAPMTASPAAVAAARRWPRLNLKLRPLRGGVRGDSLSVEFELRVENRGGGPARDVAVAAWIYAAGDGAPSEAERTLIEHPISDTIAEIGAGDAHRLQTLAALPVSNIGADSILPVVVVDIRYRRNDGEEERTSASFAVGVPVDGDLGHFDLQDSSGLHERVEARPLNELERR